MPVMSTNTRPVIGMVNENAPPPKIATDASALALNGAPAADAVTAATLVNVVLIVACGSTTAPYTIVCVAEGAMVPKVQVNTRPLTCGSCGTPSTRAVPGPYAMPGGSVSTSVTLVNVARDALVNTTEKIRRSPVTTAC